MEFYGRFKVLLDFARRFFVRMSVISGQWSLWQKDNPLGSILRPKCFHWVPFICPANHTREPDHSGLAASAAKMVILWQQTGHDLPAVAAVNFEISIGGQYHGVRQGLTHAHETRIGQAHGHICVFVHQIKNRLPFVTQTVSHTQPAIAQQPDQPGGVGARQEEKSFHDHGFAGEPRQRQVGDRRPAPGVMLIAWIEQGDERTAVNNDALRHGNERG